MRPLLELSYNIVLTHGQQGCKFAPPRFFSNIFETRANFKIRSKPISSRSNSGCFDVFRVNVAISITWSGMENQWHPPWKNRRFYAGICNFGFQRHINNFNGNPTFSTTTDLDMTMPTSPDIVDCGFKMAATKLELEITFERKEISMRFQRLPPHFRPRPTWT